MKPSGTEQKKDAFCIVVLFLFALCFLGKALFFGRVLLPADMLLTDQLPWAAGIHGKKEAHNKLISDAIVQSYPWRVHNMRAISEGRIQLWNPYQFSGAPHAANAQSGVFYLPAYLVFMIFGVMHGMGVNALIHLWFAGAGAFLLARILGISRGGSLIAGTVMMFNGWITAWLSRTEFITTYAWLPYIFLFFQISIRHKKLRYALPGALCMGLMLLAGHMQICFYSIMALFFYFAIVSVRKAAAEKRAGPALFGLAVVAVIAAAGFCIGMVQFAVSYEFLQTATRVGAVETAGTSGDFIGSMGRFLTAFMPDFFGNPIHHNTWGDYNYSENGVFCGVITLFLAAICFLKRRSVEASAFKWLAVAALLLASDTVFYHLMVRAFPLSGVFYHGRIRLLFCFAVSFLAGYGFDSLYDSPGSAVSKRPLMPMLAGALILIAAAALAVMNINALPELTAGNLIPKANGEILRFMLFFVLSLAALIISANRKGFWGSAAVLILLLADLALCGARYNTACEPEDVLPHSPVIEEIKKDSDEKFRIHAFTTGHLLAANTATALGLEDTAGYDSLCYSRYRNLLKAFQESYGSPGSFVDCPWLSFMAYNPTLLKLLNVKYVLAHEPSHPIPSGLRKIFHREGVYLYEFTGYLPRAFFTDTYALAKNDEETLRIAMSRSFNPGSTAILNRQPEFLKSDRSPHGKGRWVKILSSSGQTLQIIANVTKPSIMVVSEIDYPGWRMYVNGRENKYMRANYVFRAIPLRPGYYDIEFVFSPDSYRLGLMISVLSTICICLASVFCFIIKRESDLSSPGSSWGSVPENS